MDQSTEEVVSQPDQFNVPEQSVVQPQPTNQLVQPQPTNQVVTQPTNQVVTQQGQVVNNEPVDTPPDVVQRLTFSSESIKRLSSEDFNTTERELITLKYDDCILVLFYIENVESHQLASIWALAAKQAVGPIFAAINMLTERRVAEAFTRLKSDGSHPLHWASLRQYPYIVVYRKRWPVAIYNGPREVQAIIDYALTLACQAGYYEPMQVGGSMQGQDRLSMGPYQPYMNLAGSPDRIRTTSVQYTASEPIRGFNPNIPLSRTGSVQEAVGTQQIQQQQLNQQTGEAQGVARSLTSDTNIVLPADVA